MAACVESSFVGYAYTVCIVSFGMCSYPADFTHWVYFSIPGNIIMIAATVESPEAVFSVEGFGCQGGGTVGGGAVNYDQVNGTCHSFGLKR